MAKEQDTQKANQTDLIYAAILMKQHTNLTGMVRDVLMYARNRLKGYDVDYMPTNNEYIDEIYDIIERLTEDKVK